MRRAWDVGARLLSRVLIAFGGGLIAVAGMLAVGVGRVGDSRAASVLVGLALLVVAVLASWLRSRRMHLVQFTCVAVGLLAVGWYALTHLPAGTANAPATASTLTLPWALGLAAVGLLATTTGALTAGRRVRSRSCDGRDAGGAVRGSAPGGGVTLKSSASRDGTQPGAGRGAPAGAGGAQAGARVGPPAGTEGGARVECEGVVGCGVVAETRGVALRSEDSR